MNEICQYRKVECTYCGYGSTYQDIVKFHANQCTKYPMLCPNECSDQIYPRDQLDAHLSMCPEQEVDCTFSEMGCQKKLKRRHLHWHLENNLLQHQLTMYEAFKEMKKDKKELEIKINEMLKLSNQENNQIRSLKLTANNQPSYFSKMAEFSDLHPVAPVVFKASFNIRKQKVTNHHTAQPYHSQLFYSHPNGYKLQVKAEVICQCSNCKTIEDTSQKNSESPARMTTAISLDHQLPYHPVVSVQRVQRQRSSLESGFESYQSSSAQFASWNEPLTAPAPIRVRVQQAPRRHSVAKNPQISLAVNLYIFKGDHDSQLKWPFKEKVSITVHHQNQDYHTVEKIFEGNQNFTSVGAKLGIKAVEDVHLHPIPDQLLPQSYLSPKPPSDLFIDTEETSWFTLQQEEPPLQFDAQQYGEKKQETSTEEGLTFPLNACLVVPHPTPLFGTRHSSDCNETVYFEVTFPP